MTSARTNGVDTAFRFASAFAATCLLLASTATKAFPESPQSEQSAVRAQTVGYSSGPTNIKAYLVKPKAGGKHPAVIVVVQSSDTFSDKIRKVANEFAAQGFIAFVPELRSHDNTSTSVMPEVFVSPTLKQGVQDLEAGYEFLKADDDVDVARISAVGFGWGTWRVFMLAEDVPTLDRAVVYYGATPVTGLNTIKSPILAHYAQYDYRITGNAIWTQKNVGGSGKKFTYYVYPDVDSDFVNDSKDPHAVEATELSWKRTLEFLRSSHEAPVESR
jgi:carboxymethylenebutenolidase